MSRVNMPEIGDKIEIEAPNYMNPDSNRTIVSQIMDIIDEDNYLIATPIVNNVLVPISQGEIIKVRYAKKGTGVYLFRAQVTGRKTINNISFHLIQRMDIISKTQRRNFYRLEILLNVTISYRDENIEEKVIPALTKDISGGGTRLISNKAIELDRVVTLTIDTKEGNIVVEGKVVRCSPFQVGDFDLGIIFEDIEESVRSKIISFIFEEQRKLRKKGLI